MFPHPQTNLDLARAHHHELTRTAARHRLRRQALRRRSSHRAEAVGPLVGQPVEWFGDR